jgi:hypothetical protein
VPIFSEWSLPFKLFKPKILYEFFISSVHATCLSHLILRVLAILMIFDEYKLWSSSLCNFLQSSFTSSF